MLGKALTQAFVHDGGWSSFRGRSHGRPAGDLPGDRFVVFLQDHDQIGNRATGDRLPATVSGGLLRVGAALLLCSPFTPMLFMGEEWAASTPWQFFADPDSEELAEATRNGRREEFAGHGWDAAEVPDPCDAATFERSRLDWSEVSRDEHAAVHDWYAQLIALRRATPELLDGRRGRTRCTWGEGWFVLYRDHVAVVMQPRPRAVHRRGRGHAHRGVGGEHHGLRLCGPRCRPRRRERGRHPARVTHRGTGSHSARTALQRSHCQSSSSPGIGWAPSASSAPHSAQRRCQPVSSTSR